MRVFLDTNVVFAAFAAEGPSRALFRHLLHGAIDGVVSEQVLEELARNLRKIKAVPPAARSLVLAVVRESCEVVATPAKPRRVSRDADDDGIVAAARASGAEVLVTGDEDLLSLSRAAAGIEVLPPRALLQSLDSRRR